MPFSPAKYKKRNKVHLQVHPAAYRVNKTLDACRPWVSRQPCLHRSSVTSHTCHHAHAFVLCFLLPGLPPEPQTREKWKRGETSHSPQTLSYLMPPAPRPHRTGTAPLPTTAPYHPVEKNKWEGGFWVGMEGGGRTCRKQSKK